MTDKIQDKKNLIAQWVFDTQAILDRFHLWLENVEIKWTQGKENIRPGIDASFIGDRMERMFAMTGAVTALGTKLFGRFGEGMDLDKSGLNQVKKDADAISAYVMSECLWFLTRNLPENHAVMVSLGEGLMPKVGETPEMGSNPQLGFGRVYARPEVAKWLDKRVIKLINDPNYSWARFYREIKEAGITIWGAAIDTLENTSRFAKGKETGSMTILHLFNQPLSITKPYEGYMGNLILPLAVVEEATKNSILINFHTPRSIVLKMIQTAYPAIKREHIHVWTLRGKSRAERIGGLWQEWESLGVHVIDDGWQLPTDFEAFTESGTYAPTYSVGTWKDKLGAAHVLVCDGYAASAEAMQAASLAPLLNLKAYLSVFTSSFKLPYNKEQFIMKLNPDSPDFAQELSKVIGSQVEDDVVKKYAEMIREGIDAGIPVKKFSIEADDFFPDKYWEVLAVSGFMSVDPYSGIDGVKMISQDIYQVSSRLVTKDLQQTITFTFRFRKPLDQSRMVFNPLLIRFLRGEDYKNWAVRISDSGRIRNELQTLCVEALEFVGNEIIKIHFDRIPPEVISPEDQVKLIEILRWYKKHHPIWFHWLEISVPREI